MFNCHLSFVGGTERVGFEPTVELPPLRFSRPACSTAPAPLRKRTAELLFYVSKSKLRIAHRSAVFVILLGMHYQERNPMKRETKFPARLVVLESNDPI